MYPRKLYSALALWVVWALQLLLITCGLLFLVYHILDVVDSTPAPGSLYFMLTLHILTLIFIPVEIVLWSHHLLDPWLYFTLQALGTAWWTIYTGFEIHYCLYYVIFAHEWILILVILLSIASLLSLWAGFGYSIFVLVKMNRVGGRYGRVESESRYSATEKSSPRQSHRRESGQGLYAREDREGYA